MAEDFGFADYRSIYDDPTLSVPRTLQGRAGKEARHGHVGAMADLVLFNPAAVT
jgi:hypothetical protein